MLAEFQDLRIILITKLKSRLNLGNYRRCLFQYWLTIILHVGIFFMVAKFGISDRGKWRDLRLFRKKSTQDNSVNCFLISVSVIKSRLVEMGETRITHRTIK